MAQYKVKDPQGNLRIIQGPDGASDDEVIAQAQKLFPPSTASMGQVLPKMTGVVASMMPENALNDIKGIAKSGLNMAGDVGAGMLSAAAFPGQVISGTPVQDTALAQAAKQFGSQVAATPSNLANTAKDYIQNPSHAVQDIASHPMSTAMTVVPIADWASTSFGRNAVSELGSTVDAQHPGLIDKVKNALSTPPSQEEISTAVQNVSDSLKKAKTTASAHLNNIKASLDLDKDFSARVDALGKEPPAITDLTKEWKDHFNPQEENQPPSLSKDQFSDEIRRKWVNATNEGRTPDSGEDVTQEESYVKPDNVKADLPRGTAGLTPKAEITKLYNLKQNLQSYLSRTTKNAMGQETPAVSSADQATIQGMIKRVNDRIGDIPGGDKLREAESKFSDVRDVYDDLQKQMATPGKAEDFTRRLFSSETGKAAEARDQLAFIQQVTGKQTLSELFDLYKRQATLTAKDLYPSSIAANAVNDVGKVFRSAKSAVVPAGKSLSMLGLQHPFNTPDMQSLKDTLKNEEVKFKDSHYAD